MEEDEDGQWELVGFLCRTSLPTPWEHPCPPHGVLPLVRAGGELYHPCLSALSQWSPCRALHGSVHPTRAWIIFLTLAKHQIITSKDFRNLSKTTANISYLCLRGRKYFSLIASNICQELVQLWRLVNIPGHRVDPQCQHQHSTTVGMQPAPL